MGLVNNFVNEVRHEFLSKGLEKDSVHDNPISQMEKWIEQAVDSQILEPNAMNISTIGEFNTVSSRVVYLRGIDQKGLRFYTNYESKKGSNLALNNSISALFFYPELERQIRVEGTIEKLSDAESDAYFNTRPIDSKIGAWASEQSRDIDSRQILLDRIKMFKEKFGENVPRPPHWGGYVIIPNYFEFWQGRSARLHDRITYKKDANSKWEIKRIAP